MSGRSDYFRQLLRMGSHFPTQKTLIHKVVGGQRIFAPGFVYSTLLMCFFLGTLVPILHYFWIKKHPNHWVRNFDFAIIFSFIGVPPASPLNIASWALVKYCTFIICSSLSFWFNVVIANKWKEWSEKYSLVLVSRKAFIS
jgi:hypothetical protein